MSTPKTLTLNGPFPPRRASAKLRSDLLAYLQEHSPEVGSEFFSDAELVAMSGLSRQCVRKALHSLQREGWIERQAGKGSFVGVRAGMAHPPQAVPESTPSKRRLVRMAVFTPWWTSVDGPGLPPNWYAQEILAGLDESAVEFGISIEWLGTQTLNVSIMTQRLQQSRPDVLVVMPTASRHAFAIGEAERLNIPCLLTGTQFPDLEIPTVCEDGFQGAALAVTHLFEKGHRRIGLIQLQECAAWVFQRHDGYLAGLARCGLEPDEHLTCWLNREHGPENTDRLRAYLQSVKPTALLLTAAGLVLDLHHLLATSTLQIPRDLSLVLFDQWYSGYRRYLGLKPTVIELPLRQVGCRVAMMARKLVEKEPLPLRTALPCALIEGESVAPYPSPTEPPRHRDGQVESESVRPRETPH